MEQKNKHEHVDFIIKKHIENSQKITNLNFFLGFTSSVKQGIAQKNLGPVAEV